jgi:hypothetical protein
MHLHIFTRDQLTSVVDTEEFLSFEQSFYRIVPHAKSTYADRYNLNHWSFPGYCVESAVLITYPIVKKLFPNRKLQLCIGKYHTSIIDNLGTVYDFIIPCLDLPDNFLPFRALNLPNTQYEIIEEDQIGFWWFEHVLQYKSDISTDLIEALN